MAALDKLPAELIDEITASLPWPDERNLETWAEFRHSSKSSDYHDLSTVCGSFKRSFDLKRYHTLVIDSRRLGAFADIVTGTRFLALRSLELVIYMNEIEGVRLHREWTLHGGYYSSDESDDDEEIEDEDNQLTNSVKPQPYAKIAGQLNALFEILQAKSNEYPNHPGFDLEIAVRDNRREGHEDDGYNKPCSAWWTSPHKYGCKAVNRPLSSQHADFEPGRYRITCVKMFRLETPNDSRLRNLDPSYWSERWGIVAQYFPQSIDLSIWVNETHMIEDVELERRLRTQWASWVRKLPLTLRVLFLNLSSGRSVDQQTDPHCLGDPVTRTDMLSVELGKVAQRLECFSMCFTSIDLVDFFRAYEAGTSLVMQSLSFEYIPAHSPNGYWMTTVHPATTVSRYIWKLTPQYRQAMDEDEQALPMPIGWIPDASSMQISSPWFEGAQYTFRTVFNNIRFHELAIKLASLAQRIPQLSELRLDFDIDRQRAPDEHKCEFKYYKYRPWHSETLMMEVTWSDLHYSAISNNIEQAWSRVAQQYGCQLELEITRTADRTYEAD